MSGLNIERHEYAENTWTIHHFTGKLLVGTDDLEEAQLQLDGILGPVKPHWSSFFGGLTGGLTIGFVLAAGAYAVIKSIT